MKSFGTNFFGIQKKKFRFLSFIPLFILVSWAGACAGGVVDKFHSSAADLPDLAAPEGAPAPADASEFAPPPGGSIDESPPPSTTASAPPSLIDNPVSLQQIDPATASLITGVLTPDTSGNPTVAGNSVVQGIGTVSISDEARQNLPTHAEAEGPVAGEGIEELEF